MIKTCCQKAWQWDRSNKAESNRSCFIDHVFLAMASMRTSWGVCQSIISHCLPVSHWLRGSLEAWCKQVCSSNELLHPVWSILGYFNNEADIPLVNGLFVIFSCCSLSQCPCLLWLRFQELQAVLACLCLVNLSQEAMRRCEKQQSDSGETSNKRLHTKHCKLLIACLHTCMSNLRHTTQEWQDMSTHREAHEWLQTN